MYQLVDCIKEYTGIPATFDGEIPEFAFDEVKKPRLMIGQKYVVPLKEGHGIGTLKDACVNESEKMICGVYRVENVGDIIASSPMTDEELGCY